MKLLLTRHNPAVVTGRIDNLVDLVYDRFKNRYFPNERLIVDIIGDK